MMKSIYYIYVATNIGNEQCRHWDNWNCWESFPHTHRGRSSKQNLRIGRSQQMWDLAQPTSVRFGVKCLRTLELPVLAVLYCAALLPLAVTMSSAPHPLAPALSALSSAAGIGSALLSSHEPLFSFPALPPPAALVDSLRFLLFLRPTLVWGVSCVPAVWVAEWVFVQIRGVQCHAYGVTD